MMFHDDGNRLLARLCDGEFVGQSENGEGGWAKEESQSRRVNERVGQQ